LRSITFENSLGEKIVFKGSPFILEGVEGLGGTDADIQDQKAPYQDGSLYIDTILQPRYIELDGSIINHDIKMIHEYRKYLLKVCNPKLGIGKLTYEFNGERKEIYGVLDGAPELPERSISRKQSFFITWMCPNPYWLDPVQNTRELKAYEGDFTFPFEFPVQFGIESDTTTIYNEGDTEAPVVVEINGPITRPLIENVTTGEHMQINAIIQADQTVVIDTSPRNKRVEIRSENETRKVMGFFDHGGDFWLLAPGENEIRYRADAGIAEATATLSYQSQYVGI